VSVSSEQWQKITRGCAEIISEKELRAKLEKGTPLRIKLGVDPTAPDLHLGHLVTLRKLRAFQDLGHQIEFLIGDYTARIGDPSGRSESRPKLSVAQIEAHAKTYQEQVFRVLDKDKTHVVYNSIWFTAIGDDGIFDLQRRTTLAQMLKRADFAKRVEEEQPISLLELLYPVLQGYDSVALHCDLELGGTDQKFNLLMGRELQLEHAQEPQVVMMMPLLEGLDGVKKMSKSYGNYVAFNDTPLDMFGKLMSVPDALMPKYVELLTDLDPAELKALHPKAAKVLLAQTLTAQFYGAEAAENSAAEFERVFSKGSIPDEIPTHVASEHHMRLIDLMVEAGVAPSKKEARRLCEQRAVELGGVTQLPDAEVLIRGEQILKVGKRRFVRIVPAS
jgi:tyrosyl-tRNA synthetase